MGCFPRDLDGFFGEAVLVGEVFEGGVEDEEGFAFEGLEAVGDFGIGFEDFQEEGVAVGGERFGMCRCEVGEGVVDGDGLGHEEGGGSPGVRIGAGVVVAVVVIVPLSGRGVTLVGGVFFVVGVGVVVVVVIMGGIDQGDAFVDLDDFEFRGTLADFEDELGFESHAGGEEGVGAGEGDGLGGGDIELVGILAGGDEGGDVDVFAADGFDEESVGEDGDGDVERGFFFGFGPAAVSATGGEWGEGEEGGGEAEGGD